MKRMLFLILATALAGCAGMGGGFVGASSEKSKKAAVLNVQLAQEYLKKGQLDVARDKLKKALDLDPFSPEAHTVAGFLQDTIGDTVQAELHFRRAVEIAPKNGDMNNNYGSFLCRQGKFETADEAFRRAMADPYYRTPEVAMTNAGMCAKSAGKFAESENYLRQALDRRPNYVSALYPMAAVLHARGDHLNARAFMQRYDASGVATAEALLLGVQIETALGDLASAEDYRRRLASAYPRSEEAKSLEAQQQ